MRCKREPVAAHSRATFPVFGGISGSHSATCNMRLLRLCRSSVLYRPYRGENTKTDPEGRDEVYRSRVLRMRIMGCAWGAVREPNECRKRLQLRFSRGG